MANSKASQGGAVTVEDVTEPPDDERVLLAYREDGIPIDALTGEVLYEPPPAPDGSVGATIDGLRAAFDPSVVGKKDKFDYISHALVTERLNEVCPGWSLEITQVFTYSDTNGRLHCEGVMVALTIDGVTRMEMGGPQRIGGPQGNNGRESFMLECKNAVSDALKRAAMRFGVALYLWDSLVDAIGDEDVHPDRPIEPPAPARAPQQRQAQSSGPPTANAPQRAAQPQTEPSGDYYPYKRAFSPQETTVTVMKYLRDKGIEVTGYQGKPPNMGSCIFAANRWGKQNGFGDEIVIGTGEYNAERGKNDVRPCDIGNAVSHWARIKAERDAAKGGEDEFEDVPF
jgi:hypothetical protein